MNFVSKFDDSFSISGIHPKAQTHVESITTKAPANSIIVPDAQLLFTGDFKRSGSDLVISKGDHELRLADYFKGEKHAPLASPDGAYLTGSLVDALTGHVQVAQADGSASAVKIIGHVTKLSGSATVIRNGVSIILNNGDNVHQGDVVQTGSSSTLGITFIDGSVFGLASNAKMVLNEMVYDPNGSNNSSLMSLVAGTISFVAGATAKHGDMKVDTPVATMGIRGTACLIEIEFDLSMVQPQPNALGVLAPPVKFQVLVEPDGTTGSYVLLERATLLPMATVNQAGTVTTVSGTGAVSFLASAQLSPEVMKLISEVFSQKYTDNSNPKSDTHFTDSPIPDVTFGFKFANGDPGVGTIHVTSSSETTSGPSSSPTGPPGHIPGKPDVSASNGAVSERELLTGSPLEDKTSGTIPYKDVNAGDIPTARTAFTGFAYQDAHGNNVTATLTAAQKAAIANVSVPLIVVQDPSAKNNGTATWTYKIPDGAADFLADGEKLTLTYTAFVDTNFAPANETGTVTFTVTLTGTNDTPTVVVGQTTPTGAVVEDSNVNASGNIAADGTITFNDVDLTDTHTASFAFSSSHASASLPGFADNTSIGTFALVPVSEVPADGDTTGLVGWTFTLDDSNPVLQSLAEGQTITLVYIVTVSDGHGGTVDQEVTITITGSNDSPNHAPTIVGELTTATGDVTEDIDVNASEQIAADGTITFRDVDLIDTHTASFAPASSTSNAHLPGFTNNTTYVGTFALNPVSEDNTDTINTGSVGWTFTLDDSNPILQSLAEGQTITQVYTVTISDNHGGTVTQNVTVTITGTEDAPTIVTGSTTPTGGVVEDGQQTASGTITFQDVDLIDTHLIDKALTGGSASAPLPGFDPATLPLGTLALTLHENPADTDNLGTVDWTFTIDDALAQQLAVNQVITQTYTVSIDDQHGGTITQDVTVTITGTEDAPTIVADATTASGGVVEDGQQTASGTITFQDVDLIDTHLIDKALTGGSAAAPLPGFDPATLPLGTLALTLHENPADTDNLGTVDWTFTIDDALAQQLAVNQVITQTYTVSIDDQHGGTITQDVTVTITGTEDAPTIVADATTASGGVVEDGQQTASGTITFQDVDLIDTHLIDKALTGGSASAPLPGFDPATQPLGTLVLTLHENPADTDNLGTVDWTFTIDNALAQQLAVNQVITQTYTVSIDDQHGGTITQDVTVTITGTEDAPTIVADATTASGGVVEDGQQTASGTITFQDVDLIDTHLIDKALTGGSASAPLPGFDPATQPLGTLALTLHENPADTDNLGTVDWTFTIDNALAQQLAVNQVITQTYTVSIDDQHGGTITQDVTVTITGTEDAPTIVADATTASGGVVEDGQQTASGTITFPDVDLIDTHLIDKALTGGSASAPLPGFDPATQPLGTLVLTLHENPADTDNLGTVDWTFTIDNALAQQLAVGQVITQTYTVSIDDQNGGVITQDVTVTITGTEDAPVIDAIAATPLTEQIDTGALTKTIAVTFTDVDLIDIGHTATITGVVRSGETAGLVGLTDAQLKALVTPETVIKASGSSSGSVNLDFSAASTVFDYLAKDEVVTLTYTVAIDDGDGGVTPQTFVVTVKGTNDAPVIDAIANTPLTEQTDTSALTKTIAVTFKDVDLHDIGHSASITGVVRSGETAGLAGLTDAQLKALVTPETVIKASGSSSGSVNLDFSAASTVFDYLAKDEVVTLTYTVAIDDGDGGVTPQTFVVTVKGTNDAPVITSGPAAAHVSEEGLANGVPDDQPAGLDTTDSTSAGGTITATDVDGDALTMSLGTPSASLTSGGVAITWTLQDAGHTLIGKAGTATIITATITDAGTYNVALSGPIDHSTANLEDNKTFTVPVIVSDGLTTTPTTLTVTVEDDSPKAGPVEVSVVTPESKTNVMIVLDLSGSMDSSSGLTGLTRLDVAKAAINELLDQYDNRGDVMVRIVTFSDTGAEVGSTWISVADAKAAIAGLSAGGGTHYDAALFTAIGAFTDANKLTGPGTQNVSYFLSDGDPTAGHGVPASEQATWESFLTNNKIVSFGLGIPNVGTPANLDPIAFDPAAGTQLADSPIIVTDLSQLANTLVFTIPPVTGGVLAGGVGTTPNSFGADGGFVRSITVDGVTYTFDPAANGGAGGITTSGGGSFTYDGTTKTLTVDTDTNVVGGELAMVMTTGAFIFQPPTGFSSETVGFVLVDRDGDTASSTIHFSAAPGPDHPPIVRDDHVITNITGSGASIVIPDSALLYNDSDADGQTVAITGAITNVVGATSVTHASGNVTFTDNNTNGGSFTYNGSTTSPAASDAGNVTVNRSQTGTTLTGTGFGEILIGRNGANNTINANEGNDVLIGGTGNDTLNGGAGADMMTGGSGVDTFIVNSAQSPGTVGGAGDAGTISGYDVITDFATATDILNLQGTAAAATGTNVNGTDSSLTINGQTIKSHTISNGIITFDDANTFGSPLTLSSTANVAAVVDYLHRNDLGNAGATVAFVANIGGIAHTYIFEQVGNSPNAANDILVDLVGVTLPNLTALIPSHVLPAGVSGSPMNLALTDPADHVGPVTVAIAGVPSGWTLSEGTDNGNGSWTVQTDDIAALAITSPEGYTGALVLNVVESWTNADGSTGNAIVADNVEAFGEGVPIFAVSSDDDTLTGSSGADLFVFSQPIGYDLIYNFNASQDEIDLIGYTGFTSFDDVKNHLSADANGNVVITLADGQSITLDGVAGASLSASNFEFDQTPVVNNARMMTIGDGAVLPLSGIINNTGTIALESAGNTTTLELIQYGITLEGGGQVILSDNGENIISGTIPSVTLTNVDNTISGAGQLGAGKMTLVNDGTIVATDTNALVIDTGPNVVINAGVLEATGSGGLIVHSDVANSGLIWANGGDITITGAVTDSGTALISGAATLEFGAASSVNVTFAGAGFGTLVLDDPTAYAGQIFGFTGTDPLNSDLVDLRGIAFDAGTSWTYSDNTGSNTGGILTIFETANGNTAAVYNLTFGDGEYTTANFVLTTDGDGGTLIADPPADSGTVGFSDFSAVAADLTPADDGSIAHTIMQYAGADQFVFAPTSGAAAVQHAIADFFAELHKVGVWQFDNIGSLAALTEAQQGHDTLLPHDSVSLKNVVAAYHQASDFIISHGS